MSKWSVVEKSNHWMVYIVVFTGGAATLAAEISASRLLGAYFGVGNVVWASVIGLVLLYLSAGYYLGGRLADRFPYPAAFYQTALWAAFLCGLIPVLAEYILPVIVGFELPLVVAVLLAVLLLFTVPVVLLGFLSPLAIRLMLDDVDRAGKIAGRLYAVSSMGSVFGSLMPVLYFLPSVGTTATFELFAGGLLVIAYVGLFLRCWRLGVGYLVLVVVYGVIVMGVL